jgi:hypothetical protein
VVKLFVNYLHKAASTMFSERGWLCIPLTYDSNKLPKVPIVKDWTNLDPSLATIDSLPWGKAAGLGIVLGAKSSNLGVLDIDDQHLAQVIPPIVWDGHPKAPRIVRTARKRLHVYVQEEDGPSSSSRHTIEWMGNPVTIELKANGTQVAAPPSPGYELISRRPVWVMESLAQAWELITDFLQYHYPDHLKIPDPTATSTANYPDPWQPVVVAGERDNAAYVEACRLRESGMPQEQAMNIMSIRFQQHYHQQGIEWGEVRRTIESAYSKKGLLGVEGGENELQFLG